MIKKVVDMDNNPDLLNAMLNDQKRQNGLFKTGSYWKGYCSRIVDELRSNGLRDFRSNAALSKGYGDCVVLDPSTLWGSGNWKSKLLKQFVNNKYIKGRLIKPYLDCIESHYNELTKYQSYYYEKMFGEWFEDMANKFELPDTLYGGCKKFVDIGERRISLNYLRMLMRIYDFSRVLDFTKVKTVFEIGGGFGSNAHLLLHLYPNIKKYLYLDIPPVLYVATQYLKHFYPKQVIEYLSTRNKKHISFSNGENQEIIAVCPWQIEDIDIKIDLFWNAASFQEMEVDTLRTYSEYVKKFTNKDGVLCLIVYKGGDKDRTRSVEFIRSLFIDSFDIKTIDPQIEMTEPRPYYLFG